MNRGGQMVSDLETAKATCLEKFDI